MVKNSAWNSSRINFRANYIFMIIDQSDICNFADNDTLYSCGEWLTEIKENLIFDTKSILNWFRLNSLKASPGKVQFMILGITFITKIY